MNGWVTKLEKILIKYLWLKYHCAHRTHITKKSNIQLAQCKMDKRFQKTFLKEDILMAYNFINGL